MNPWLLFLLKSTLVLSLLYLFFRLLVRKETLFLQSRLVLVLIVVFSAIIPVSYLPSSSPTIIPEFIEPEVSNSIDAEAIPTHGMSSSDEHLMLVSGIRNAVPISAEMVLLLIYSAGVLISVCLFLYRLFTVLQIIRKSRRSVLNGVRLNIVNDDIPAFTFGKNIVISKQDYETNSQAILTHELSHISQGHFYDLMLMELVKVIYWFNPIVYYMNRDIKEIHEFQADEHTIKSGIDAVNYQLLIIQKSVGQQKFALANSFNHCQIKNRITMMNKSKNSKSWNWKVATFLPLLVFLLMAFGRKDEHPPEIVNLPIVNPLENIVSNAEIEQNQYEEFKQKIEIRKDGNYINSKSCSLEEIKAQDLKWREASNSPIFLLVDATIPNKRVDEVRQSLDGYHWVVQATVGSDELIYYHGDVSEAAKFTKGTWSNWLGNQMKNFPEAKSLSNSKDYVVTYGFIIDKNGKVRDGHVIEGCKYPEINSALNKILTQIPDWQPAMRGNEEVSVYYRAMRGRNIAKVK